MKIMLVVKMMAMMIIVMMDDEDDNQTFQVPFMLFIMVLVCRYLITSL